MEGKKQFVCPICIYRYGCEAKMLLPNSTFILQFIHVTFTTDLGGMLGPKCNNGFFYI